MQEVDIDEVEEIKEVGGRTYSKMSQLFTDTVTDQHILEPSTGAIEQKCLSARCRVTFCLPPPASLLSS